MLSDFGDMTILFEFNNTLPKESANVNAKT